MATGGLHSIKSRDSRGLEPLSPEGSVVCVRADDGTLRDRHGNDGNHGNPITEQNTILGIPRKPSSKSPLVLPTTPASNGSSHAPPDPLEPELSVQEVLREAGVELELSKLQLTEGGGAPLELVSQFIACVMDEEFEAASLLCEKILEFEPGNSTALEFLPLILERLRLDAELPSESSSDSTSSNSSSSGSSSSSSESEEEEQGVEQGVEPKRTTHRNCLGHHH